MLRTTKLQHSHPYFSARPLKVLAVLKTWVMNSFPLPIASLSDLEAIRANRGKEPRQAFVIQLREAVEEWRRRHNPKLAVRFGYRKCGCTRSTVRRSICIRWRSWEQGMGDQLSVDRTPAC